MGGNRVRLGPELYEHFFKRPCLSGLKFAGAKILKGQGLVTFSACTLQP